MYGEKVKIYGEDLNVGPVLVGGTMGALVAHVFADANSVTIAAAAKVTISAADTKDGSFTTAAEAALAEGTYAKGDLIATVTLPADIKMWAKAAVTGNTGNVRVTLGYLPR